MRFDHENASKHYCHWTNYRVRTLKATVLVDTDPQAILDIHCATEKTHSSASRSPTKMRTNAEF